jgi:hypothetical protein
MIQGIVEALAKSNETGFKIGDNWHNVFPGQPRPSWKDTVSFTEVLGSDGKMYAQDVQITAKAPSGGGGGGGRGGWKSKPKDPAAQYGPIIGHNLLVAATILGEGGKDVAALIELTQKITEESSKLVDRYVAHKTANTAPVVAQVQPVVAQAAPAPTVLAVPQAAPVAAQAAPFDDDIPW